jgi:hypothetical protein
MLQLLAESSCCSSGAARPAGWRWMDPGSGWSSTTRAVGAVTSMRPTLDDWIGTLLALLLEGDESAERDVLDAPRRDGPSGPGRPLMNHGQASKWLRAIGGTSTVVHDSDGRDFVVVSVESASRGSVSRRMAVDESTVNEQEAIRDAFVRACEELRLALS